MSKCMTIADETVDQKDICLDKTPKEIVQIILEEALLSALIVSDKGISRIGDSNITDEFRQQYDQLSNQKDFEQVEPSQALPGANKDPILNSRENLDRAALSARGNLEQLIDSFVKEEEKTKSLNDCQVITEEILADNELQIKNGQIHLEKNKTISDTARQEYFVKKDVIKDEKIEIEYYNKGQLNRIYVPLNVTGSVKIESDWKSKQEDDEKEKEGNELVEDKMKENTERPFQPFTTEELRQVWENENSSLVGRWDSDILAHKDKVVKIMEELSSVQVFPDNFSDPNRPRACAFDEEDVKKMTKEIQNINFTQSHASSEDSMSYYPDGQGDADLESDSFEKPQNEYFNSSNHTKNNSKNDQNHLNEDILNQTYKILPNIKAACDSKENCFNNPRDDMISSVEKKKSLRLDLTYSTQSQPDIEKNSELYRNDSVNVNESLNESFETRERFNEYKRDDLTPKDPDLTPDLDFNLIQEPSPVTDSPNLNQAQQGTLSWSGLKWGSKEAICTLNSNSFLEEKHWERISVDHSPLSEEREGKRENNDAGHFLQDACKSIGVIQNGEDANLNAEIINERLEETLICAEKNVENFEKLEERVDGDETLMVKLEREQEHFMNAGPTFYFAQTAISAQKSEKAFNCEDGLNNSESCHEPSASSKTSQIQVNEQSVPDNELSEGTEALVSGSQKFKLHSQKMYLSPHLEPAGQVPNDFNLTESEEAFIDMSENVIQIIDPPENSADEDSNVISFSLLAEMANTKSTSLDADAKSDLSLKTKDLSENDLPKRVYSGMTTIGPIKNIDYDPKDLTAPEIDFGKMTRITSSRQLARDMGLLNSENPALSVRIIEEDDSDEDMSLNLDDEHLDRNSLVNRDIASLTKVQKVREVMSHQAKPDEDFEDEDSLPRPRLDLKDVESMTDERYKFQDVSIPLLSFEIGDRNLDAEKELIESMSLVISGLTNSGFYEEESEDSNGIQANNSTYENGSNSKAHAPDRQSSKTETSNPEEIIPTHSEEEKATVEFAEENSEKEVLDRKGSQHGNTESLKSSTLGNVFRKASNKFMRKDSDLLMRNSKSLPRDANKMSATNSIRSILDDCQSSATSMLKKSCSLLKNTESIFKSISQSMVTSDRSSGSNTTQKRLSPSESDVSTIEKKFSGFLKKEDFTKAKNLIKSKVEKTFKSSERENSPSEEPEISSKKEDLKLVVRNENNLRIDRIENFKKFLPKSPLVYKSQFVRSQMNFQTPPEPESATNPFVTEKNTDETLSSYRAEGNTSAAAVKEKELLEEVQPVEIYSQEALQWIIHKEELQLPVNKNLEPQQPDFIVMETIQGLPASDLESPSSEKENMNVENNTIKGNDLKKIEASNSSQILTGSSHDVAPRFTDTDEEKTTTKTPSERKIKTKKKKFTARFRSFWCSAFGRAKTPEKKGDLS